MTDSTNQTTTRRTALRRLAAATATTALPVFGQNPPENHHSSQPVTKESVAYTYQFFSPSQLETLDALGETIIPADEHSPGAKAARVSQYIDAIVADASADTKRLWTTGLAAVERASKSRFNRSYAHCSEQDQTAVLKTFAVNQQSPVSLEEKFFKVLKLAVIDGYYTSAIGIHQDLQYQGNQALASFPGCQHTPSEAGHS